MRRCIRCGTPEDKAGPFCRDDHDHSFYPDDHWLNRKWKGDSHARQEEAEGRNEGQVAHVVMFSGGAGSWATAKRVAERHGTDRLTLLFADTKVEDPDTYRFLHAAARNVGGELVVVEDGRTPFEVFHDDRFLGNARLANCSKFLKQKPCREWLEANRDPETTVLYVGIDWTEQHRLRPIAQGWQPYTVGTPMCDPPYMDKPAIFAWLKREGIKPPRDYDLGLPHANCGAQGCVRGGQAYWRRLLEGRREVYLKTEREEQALREHLGKDVAMLRDRTGGTVTPMTLREFRERIEAHPTLFDASEWGGCGCFVDDGYDGTERAAA